MSSISVHYFEVIFDFFSDISFLLVQKFELNTEVIVKLNFLDTKQNYRYQKFSCRKFH